MNLAFNGVRLYHDIPDLRIEISLQEIVISDTVTFTFTEHTFSLYNRNEKIVSGTYDYGRKNTVDVFSNIGLIGNAVVIDVMKDESIDPLYLSHNLRIILNAGDDIEIIIEEI